MPTRSYVKLTVGLDAGWRVGAWQSTAADVRGAARDPMNPTQPHVPGTSIAGSLKASLNPGDAELLFGSLATGSSPWWILGTTLTPTDIDTRTQTAISRHRRAAAKAGQSRAEEATTATLTVYLRSDTAHITPLLDAVQAWQPRVGGGRTIGLGRARLTSITHRTLDLDHKDDLMGLIGASGTATQRVDELLAHPHATRVPITPLDPAELVTFEVRVTDMGLLEKTADHHITHGSQWKGMLRSRTEYIARSLGHPPCITEDQWTGCGHCDLCDAFGSSNRSGAWEFHNSPWESGTHQHRTRIAIDRFTSGVRDGATFTEHTQHDVLMTASITTSRDTPTWVGIALLHAIRDLNDGLWGIGPRTAIGLGTAQVTNLSCTNLAGIESGLVDFTALPAVPLPTDLGVPA